MPQFIFRILDVRVVKPTFVTLQLYDKSFTYAKGVVDDILIKVDKFIFTIYFIMFIMKGDREIPIILGRPFLPTSKVMIVVYNGELNMRV